MKRKRKALTLGTLAWRGYLQVTTFAIGLMALAIIAAGFLYEQRTQPPTSKYTYIPSVITDGKVIYSSSGIKPAPEPYSFQDFIEELIDTFLSTPELMHYTIFCLIVAALLIACMVVLGKTKAPRHLGTKGDYERKSPIPDAHPITLSRLWNGHALIDDVILGILALSEKGVVKLADSATSGKKAAWVGDLSISVLRDQQHIMNNEIDIVLYEFLLVESNNGELPFRFSTLFNENESQTSRELQRDFLIKFFQATRKEAAQSGLFPNDAFSESSTSSNEIAQRVYIACLAMPIVSTVFGLFIIQAFSFNYSTLLVYTVISCLPWLAYGIFWLIFDLKRNAEGQRMLSRCKHLKKWLKDFTSIKSKPSASSILVWGKYAVYAYALDVSTKSINELSLSTFAIHDCAMEIIEDHPSCRFDKHDNMNHSSHNAKLYYKLIQGNLETDE